MAEIDELREKLTNIRTKTQQIADNLNVPYTAGEMTLSEIGNLLDDIEEHDGGGGFAATATLGQKATANTSLRCLATVTVD